MPSVPRSTAYYRANKDKEVAAAKRRREAKLVAGLCVSGGCTAPRSSGTYCEAHRLRNIVNQLKQRGAKATLESVMDATERSSGACPVCHREFTPELVGCFDHNPNTGEMRDQICQECNLALGQAKDSAERLRALADYLDRWNR